VYVWWGACGWSIEWERGGQILDGSLSSSRISDHPFPAQLSRHWYLWTRSGVMLHLPARVSEEGVPEVVWSLMLADVSRCTQQQTNLPVQCRWLVTWGRQQCPGLGLVPLLIETWTSLSLLRPQARAPLRSAAVVPLPLMSATVCGDAGGWPVGWEGGVEVVVFRLSSTQTSTCLSRSAVQALVPLDQVRRDASPPCAVLL
jgi:hypothetical protein